MPKGKKVKEPSFSWTEAKIVVLLDTLMAEKTNNLFVDRKVNPKRWSSITETLCANPTVGSVTVDQVKGKVHNMNTEWKAFARLKTDKTGTGTDPATGNNVVTSAVESTLDRDEQGKPVGIENKWYFRKVQDIFQDCPDATGDLATLPIGGDIYSPPQPAIKNSVSTGSSSSLTPEVSSKYGRKRKSNPVAEELKTTNDLVRQTLRALEKDSSEEFLTALETFFNAHVGMWTEEQMTVAEMRLGKPEHQQTQCLFLKKNDVQRRVIINEILT